MATKPKEIQIKSTLNFFKVLFFSSLLGSLNFIIPIPSNFFGFSLSGYAWILIFLVSVCYLLGIIHKSYFSIKIWLIWVGLLLIYLFIDFSTEGLQGTMQFLLPIIIGTVAGGLKYNKRTLKTILIYLKYLIIVTLLSTTILSYVKFGILGYGPATDAHLAALSGVIVLTLYYNSHKMKFLVFYFLIALIPLLAATRTGILVMLLIPLGHFHKLFSFFKTALLLILIPISIYIFYLPSIQEKMFHDGSGDIQNVDFNSDNFNTSGRSLFNEILIEEFKKNPIYGQGPRADYFAFQNAGLKLTEAHNDYLQVLTSYGVFGGLVLLFCFVFQIKRISKLQSITKIEKNLKITFYTLFIPLILFMATDTVLRMSYSFINYFFAIAGIFFSVHNSNVNILKYNNENNSGYPLI